MIGSGLLALITVFVAELGDKTQLLALGFGSRHRLSTVIVGLALGYATSNVIAAGVGAVIGEALPTRAIAVGGGVVFILLALLSLRQPAADAAEDRRIPGPVILAIAATIVLGELGDKTQIATAALAANGPVIATWIGATIGVTAAGALGAIVGRRLSTQLDPSVMRRASAASFAVAGVVTIVAGVQ